MKTILLAAAALIAVPAMAQTSGSTGTSSPSNVGASDQPNSMKNPAAGDAMPTDPATTTQQAPMQNMSAPDGTAPSTTAAPEQGTTTTEPMPATPPAGTTGGNMTPGGYQPSTPMAMAQPGSPPATFTPGPSVEQAYPAPAPLAEYPICKKGQYDKCRQRGG